MYTHELGIEIKRSFKTIWLPFLLNNKKKCLTVKADLAYHFTKSKF